MIFTFLAAERISAARKLTPPLRLFLLLTGFILLLCGVPAALAHSLPVGCTGSALGINLFTDSPDVHVGDTLRYSVTVFNGLPGSPRVACDSTAIQAFVVTPDGRTNIIPLVRTTLLNGQSDFYPNVASYVVRAQDILPDGSVRATASDTGIIHQNDTDSVGGGFQGVNTEVSLPCIQIAVQCLGGVGENGAITFTGSVTNCGNNTLVNVTVTNLANNGAFTVLFPTNLIRGQVAFFSGSYIPSDPCNPGTDILVAHGIDQFTTAPRTVTSSANATCSNVLTPGIRVTKTCPTTPVSPGQLLVFSGTVSNTGNVYLTNIVVVNNQPSANTPVFTLASLAPGAVATFTGSYLAPTNCSVSDTLAVRAQSRCGTLVTDSATATCPILTTPQIAVLVICPTIPVLPGGVLTYKGSVRNTGDTPLTNIVVMSDRPAANTTIFTTALLAPGALANFTGSYTVPATGCAVTATFKATGKDSCTGAAATNSFLSTCTVATAPAIVVTLVCPALPATTGGAIVYSGTVRNSGNVTLNNVVVVSDQPVANTVVFTVASLAPGASANYIANCLAPVDACSVRSTVIASGQDLCSSVLVTNTASATCTLLTTPGLVVTQDCPAIPAIPGRPLLYSGTVRNAGNITLTNVIVLNNLSGLTPLLASVTLAPGQSTNFSGSYLAPTNCSSTSISTATGRSLCGVSVTNSVTAVCTILTTPQIAVTVLCPITTLVPGGLLTYTGTVRNTGDIALTNVVVVSDRPGANTTVFTVVTLVPGASTNFTGSYTVPANSCSVIATFKASGRDLCTGLTVTNTFLSTCTVTTAPAIAVTVVCPALPATTGGLLIYTGTVRNTGNVTLTDVVVVNNQPVPNTVVLTVASLAPGASVNYTANCVAPADSCSVTSIVTATGKGECSGALVSNNASATCTFLTAPGILITQDCPASPGSPGRPFLYTGTVRNTGNITLTNVIVLNSLGGTNPLLTVLTLAPGQLTNFSGSYLAPTNCSITSIVTATGRSICGVAVTHSLTTTCAILTTPAIKVTQTCPIVAVLPGGLLTYTGTVRNVGDITLTNVMVFNDRSGTAPIFTLASLAPGATTNFSGSYVTHEDCCVDTSTVTARGQGCDAVTVSDTATRTCTVSTTPKIVVTKVCQSGLLRPGDLLTYSGTVSNGGNITLIKVMVMNHQPGNPATLLGPINLAPGETVSYFASYVVPVDFCGSDTVTASGIDLCTSATITHSVTTACAVATTPRLGVSKNCPIAPTQRGGLYTFTGTVTNSGNVTLFNVTVVNNQPTNNTPILGPITLAPGASVNYTGSFIAPLDCCEIIDKVTVRGQDRCTSLFVSATASQVCPLATNPRLTLTQFCPVTPIPMGSVYRFSGSISNSGDITLTNVFVASPEMGNNTPVLGPMELAPGESETFSGSYLVPLDTCSVVLMGTGQSTCDAGTVTNTAACLTATNPRLVVTQNCPLLPSTAGLLMTYSGSISNAGDLTLRNVVVTNDRSGTTPLYTAALLAPGASADFTGSFIAPMDCSVTSSSTARATSLCGAPLTNSASATCLVLTQPAIAVSLECPPSPATPGSLQVLSGTVTNTGNITLTNVVVVDDQAGSGTRLLGPMTLLPGAGARFTGSHLVLGIPNLSTNSVSTVTTNFVTVSVTNNTGSLITTNTTVTLSTNTSAPAFVTLNPVSQAAVDRFSVPNNLEGLTFADQDKGYAATQFYSMRKDTSGTSFFDTITAGTSAVTDRFAASSRQFDSLTFASPDVGYGPILFYSLSHDSAGVSRFGTVAPGGAVGVVTDQFVVGSNFDSLTFAATDVGYGANLFYYVRHDANGLSTFGTINPAQPGTITDRFSVGRNVEALVFTASDVGAGYGVNNFYYLRRNSAGGSTFGTLLVTGLNTGTVTDRFDVGNHAKELTFTTTDAGFGPNLFYFLRGGVTLSTNSVTTYTTNSAPMVTTSTNTLYTTNTVTTLSTNIVPVLGSQSVTARGTDICQARTVSNQATCSGSNQPAQPVIGGAGVPPSHYSNGAFSMSFASQTGQSYTVQFKKLLSDLTWTDLPNMPIVGNGGPLTITDSTPGQSMRFYRVILTP